ncbi:hypothetical protein ACWEQV_23040 [Rhodococcus aetherivorans]
MDLFDVAWACVRRWYVFVPLMGVTLLISYRTYTGVEPVYYSSTTLGLANASVTAQQQSGEVRSNGLVSAGGPNLVANLLAMGLNNGAVAEQVVAAGGLPDYTAEVFSVPGGQLPLVVISTTSPDSDAARKTIELVAAQGVPTMRALQQNAGVPEDQMLIPYATLAPGEPTAAMPSRTRSTLAIFVACAGLSVVLTLLFDLLAKRFGRKRRIRAHTAVPDSPAGNGPPIANHDGSATTRTRSGDASEIP